MRTLKLFSVMLTIVLVSAGIGYAITLDPGYIPVQRVETIVRCETPVSGADTSQTVSEHKEPTLTEQEIIDHFTCTDNHGRSVKVDMVQYHFVFKH
jgi:hypothetical protein